LEEIEKYIDDLEKEYQEWCKWDIQSAKDTLYMLPVRIGKLQYAWRRLKRKLDKIDEEIDNKWIYKFEYYKNSYDINLSNSEIKNFIEKDSSILELKSKRNTLFRNLELIEKYIKNMEGIQWNIKTLLEYEKFFSGM
jgi:uncharacterized coiled-coil DUF342 family protein